MALSTYSPEDVIFLLAGVIAVDGYTDGTFISIKKNVSPFSTKTSADGSVSRIYNQDDTYTVTLTLSQFSSSNDVLTKLALVDQITQRGKFPLLIKDTNGSSLFAAATCWIDSIPETTYSNEISSRTWVLYACNGVYNVGGNEDASGLLEDLANTAISSIPILQGSVRAR